MRKEMSKPTMPDPFIELLGLEFCGQGECDHCTSPENGSYARMYRPGDDAPECESVVCGKCVVETQKKGNGIFYAWNLPDIILPF